MDQPSLPPDSTPAVSAKRGLDRRTLLRAGAAATPVILTLHSGPVSASGSVACTVASSFVSVTTFASRNPNIGTMQCTTMNAVDWQASAKALATATERPAWATQTVLAYLGRATSTLPGMDGVIPDAYQVWQVMALGPTVATSGELGVLQHILGLALSMDYGNGVVNTGGVMSTSYLRGVWANYKTTGGYKLATSNIDWSETELISWLRMSQFNIPIPAAVAA